MTQHTKGDGLPGPEETRPHLGIERAAPRNDQMASNKVECNACPVLCQISEGRVGACDRYANQDGVLVRLDPVVLLRKRLSERFPSMVFFFEPANITNQILNFGLPAPIDLQVFGRDAANNFKLAQRLRDKIARVPGAADVHIHQVFQQPQINVNVDRTRAGQLGLTQRDVTGSMLISLSGNNQVAPNFWLNPANGVSYNVGVQTSPYRIDSLDQLLRTPVTPSTTAVNVTTPGSLKIGRAHV